jgi:hypothetical protein
MGQKSASVKEPAKQVVKEIRRATRCQFSAEENIRIVLTGLRGRPRCRSLQHRCYMPDTPLAPPTETLWAMR